MTIFKKLANDEDKGEKQNKKINELLKLLCNEHAARRLIDILNMLKQSTQVYQPLKKLCKMDHLDKSDFDPQVNLEIGENVYHKSWLISSHM